MGELPQLASQCIRVGLAEATRMSRQLIASALKRSRVDSFRALPKCIRCVHQGQIWPSNTELEFLIEVITKLNSMLIHKAGGMALLTRREQDIVRLVADGMRNQGISRKLNLRKQTVSACVFRVFEKLGISNRVELVLYALSEPEYSPARERSRAGANHNS